jgi:GNAT superfamily N-acetyltransferase
MTLEIVKLSSLDQERFGIVTAKTDQVNTENIDGILEFCAKNDVQLLIARCPSEDMSTVHALQKNGFLLMETLLHFKMDLTNYIPKEYHGDITTRLITPEDIPEVVKIAREAFSSYYGHYHADPRLDPVKATEVYSSWAERCCTEPGVVDYVFVIELEDKIVGFRAFRFISPHQGEFVLAGISPAVRRRGVFKATSNLGFEWCKSIGVTELRTSTHLLNIAIQNTCTQMGYKLSDSLYTFHKWFD